MFWNFGLAPVLNRHDTICRAFALAPNNVRTWYDGLQEEDPTARGSPLNEMSTACEIFDGGSRVIVVRVFRDALSILSSLNYCAGLGVTTFHDASGLEQ